MRTPAKSDRTRSMSVTIISALVALLILAFILSLLPLQNIWAVMIFAVGILLVIITAATAISGKKGGVRELIYTITFWV